jgi:flagellar protein FlaG
MSSEYMTSIPLIEASRLHEAPQSSRVPHTRQPDKVQQTTVVAGGGDVPPGNEHEAKHAADFESTVSQISDFVQNFQRSLQFSVDKDSGRTVIKVVDSNTEEVIRQIPAEEILRMAQRLDSPESLMLAEQA